MQKQRVLVVILFLAGLFLSQANPDDGQGLGWESQSKREFTRPIGCQIILHKDDRTLTCRAWRYLGEKSQWEQSEKLVIRNRIIIKREYTEKNRITGDYRREPKEVQPRFFLEQCLSTTAGLPVAVKNLLPRKP